MPDYGRDMSTASRCWGCTLLYVAEQERAKRRGLTRGRLGAAVYTPFVSRGERFPV